VHAPAKIDQMWKSSEREKIHMKIIPKLTMHFLIWVNDEFKRFKVTYEWEAGHTKEKYRQA
jgi:hypothetical protein